MSRERAEVYRDPPTGKVLTVHYQDHRGRYWITTQTDHGSTTRPDWSKGWLGLRGMADLNGFRAFSPREGAPPNEDSGGWYLPEVSEEERAASVRYGLRPPLTVLSIRGHVADYIAMGARNGVSPWLWVRHPARFGDLVVAVENRLAGIEMCKECDGTGNYYSGPYMACPECGGTGGVGGTGVRGRK